VVPITAAFAAKRSGYARTALDLLYTAGDLARSGDDALVTEEHVRKAESEIQQGAIVSEIASLSPQGKLVARTSSALSDQGELPAKMDAFTHGTSTRRGSPNPTRSPRGLSAIC